MRVVLDELQCDLNAASVSEAIVAAAALAENRGRIIVEIRIDGEPHPAANLDEIDRIASSATEVRLTSADPTDVVCQALHEASLSLTDVQHLQQSAAQLIQAGQMVQAMEQLGQAISIWINVQQAVVMGVELAELDLNQLLWGGRDKPIGVLIEELADQLRIMREALESQDIGRLSDTLMYELPTVVDQWGELLADLQKQVKLPRRG